MARKVQLGWKNRKARKAGMEKRLNSLVKKTNELSILCDAQACFIFFDREEDKLTVWPSPEATKSLIDKFYSLTDHERHMKALEPESFIQTNIQKIKKKLAECRKVFTEIEMEHLMFDLQIGRDLADLSPTEVEQLIPYSSKKMMCFSKQIDSVKQLDTSVDEASPGDETLRASNVASESVGAGFNVMETGSVYYFDNWVSVDPEVPKPCDETHLPTLVSTGSDINMEPSDVDEGLGGTSKGESSKAGGTEDDAE